MNTRTIYFFVMSCFVLVTTVACNPSYAPPARLGIGGMPEAYSRGSGEARVHLGGAGGTGVLLLEPGTRVGVGHRVEIETGVALGLHNREGEDLTRTKKDENGNNVTDSSGKTVQETIDRGGSFTMPSVGVRYQLVDHRIVSLGLSAGVGVGWGGAIHNAQPSKSSVTGSGYLGLDLGVRAHHMVGLYFPVRVQVSGNAGVPTTVWWQTGGGLSIDWTPWAFTTAEVAYAGYRSFGITTRGDDDDGAHGVQFGFALGFRWGDAKPSLLPKSNPTP